jgi:hypothetical protein
MGQLKILSARMVTINKLHTEDQQMFGAIVKDLVAMATWRQGFVQTWFYLNDYI